MSITKSNIGIVIPYYNASSFIVSVVRKALEYSDYIVIVNDKSPDQIPLDELKVFEGVEIVESKINMGVGGATKIGFDFLEKIETVKVIVKLDADDQMDTNYIPQLVEPILINKFDFVKGNRFRDFNALKKMPTVRRHGNLMLSFLSKMATGYWNCFDFNNGFFAISIEKLKMIDKTAVANNYFFETSLISELYFQKSKIKEVAMPAIYGNEDSNMKIFKMPFLFAGNLFKKFISRIWKAYFVYDFNIASIYILFGFPLFFGGLFFGGINWYVYASNDVLTPLGTIMISTLLIILGFQLILQAIQYDIINTPRTSNDE